MNLSRQFDGPSPSPFFLYISILQVVLLPLSLSPRWTRRLGPVVRYHYIAVFIHLGLFALVFNAEYKRKVGVLELARWALPEIVAGAVEIQRRGEIDAENKLALLEGLKYEHKGA
jgi:hypothetical protein